MPRITKRLVDGLPPESVGRIVREDEVTGFGVRLNADGSRTYLVEYRAGRGRGFPTRRISIGRHGALTPDAASKVNIRIMRRALLTLCAMPTASPPASSTTSVSVASTKRSSSIIRTRMPLSIMPPVSRWPRATAELLVPSPKFSVRGKFPVRVLIDQPWIE